jgi:hypothetical protein
LDFWFENKPSGNPVPTSQQLLRFLLKKMFNEAYGHMYVCSKGCSRKSPSPVAQTSWQALTDVT